MKIDFIEMNINDAPACGTEFDGEFVRHYRAQ